MTVAVISHRKCSLHDNGIPHHPESPERLEAINNQLIMSGVDWICSHYDAAPATRKHLQRVHDDDYVQRVFDTAPSSGEKTVLDGDTGMNENTLDAACYFAGAGVMAVDLVMGTTHRHAACLGRPPGHHAGRAKAAGFCIFNNVAVAAGHALEEYGLERIVIVDFDVHHGDGTEEIFRDESRILFCSSFQHPFYPFKGADSSYPNVINLPMKAGIGSAKWRQQIITNWVPELEAFRPQLVIISAGFDSHLEDDMGGFNLVEADYVWITRELCRIAKEHGESRVISCLEGGYDLSSLGRSVTAHIKELAEFH